MTTPSPALNHSHVPLLSLRHWHSSQTRFSPSQQPQSTASLPAWLLGDVCTALWKSAASAMLPNTETVGLGYPDDELFRYWISQIQILAIGISIDYAIWNEDSIARRVIKTIQQKNDTGVIHAPKGEQNSSVEKGDPQLFTARVYSTLTAKHQLVNRWNSLWVGPPELVQEVLRLCHCIYICTQNLAEDFTIPI